MKISDVFSALLPGRTARVVEARAKIAEAHTRRAHAEYLRSAYDAAKTWDRNRARNSRAVGPVTETSADRYTTLVNYRDLDRNTSWLHGVMNGITNNVIGTGIRLEAQVKKKRKDSRLPRGPGGIQLDAYANEQIEVEWEKWAKAVDVNRSMSFVEAQWMAYREFKGAGESLIVLKDVEPSKESLVPLAIEIVPSERLSRDDKWPDNKSVVSGNEVIQGIEFRKADGKRVAYWIWPQDPTDSTFADMKPVRVPAERVIHLYRPGRPGMIRGMTAIHSVARTVEALAQYLDHELTRARVSSAFALMVKRGGLPLTLPQASDSETVPASTEVTEGLLDGGGFLLSGGPNDGFESAGPNVPGISFQPFVKLMLQSCAVGLGVSYGFLARDHSDANFSSARQDYLEDLRNWRPEQLFFVEKFCKPIFRAFAERAGIIGIAPFTSMEDYDEQVRWRTQGWDWVDPMKEIQADVLAIQNGLLSPQEVCQEHGRDYYETVDQLAEAKLYAEAADVQLGIFPQQPIPMVTEDGAEEDANGGKDGGGKPSNGASNGQKPEAAPTNGTRPGITARRSSAVWGPSKF